jgi:hypothetical protein
MWRARPGGRLIFHKLSGFFSPDPQKMRVFVAEDVIECQNLVLLKQIFDKKIAAAMKNRLL